MKKNSFGIYTSELSSSREDRRTTFLDENCNSPQHKHQLVALLHKRDAFVEAIDRDEDRQQHFQLVPGRTVDRYQIIEPLGKGTFGSVYLVEHLYLKRRCALKVPNQSRLSDFAVKHFIDEGRRAIQLKKHPGVAEVYDAGLHGTVLTSFTSGLKGFTLSEYLRQTSAPGLKVDVAIRIVEALAKALAHLHSYGLYHRDLNPRNVMLTKGLRPVIIDFGAALTRHELGLVRLFDTGTLRYIAPERFDEDAHQHNAASDLYSLGAIFYEMLCGQPPFQSRETSQLIEEIQHVRPPPPTQRNRLVAAKLSALCLRCLAKRPQDRFAKVSMLHDALQKWRRQAQTPHGFHGARRWVAAAAFVFVGAVALWGYHSLAQNDRSSQMHLESVSMYSPVLRPDYNGGLFSDRDESAAATTQITYENLGPDQEIHSYQYTIRKNYKLGYEYCGTEFPVASSWSRWRFARLSSDRFFCAHRRFRWL